MSNRELEMKAREHDVSDFNEEVVAELVEVTAKGVTSGYQKIEDGVVGGYKKIETGVVEGFGKVVDKCVEVLFAKEGETVEEAKQRLSANGNK